MDEVFIYIIPYIYKYYIGDTYFSKTMDVYLDYVYFDVYSCDKGVTIIISNENSVLEKKVPQYLKYNMKDVIKEVKLYNNVCDYCDDLSDIIKNFFSIDEKLQIDAWKFVELKVSYYKERANNENKL